MKLGCFKIFSISKDKRLLKINDDGSTFVAGIYDANKYDYETAVKLAEKYNANISVHLGPVYSNINLICLDLDDCILPTGAINEETRKFLDNFETYEYEPSISGFGCHIYLLTKNKWDTSIVKDIKGCKSFELYTKKRHIVTTTFDFKNTPLIIGKYDHFIGNLLTEFKEKEEKKSNTVKKDIINLFEGKVITDDADVRGAILKREPVRDMYALRGLGYKDPKIIELIDASPDSVDQSAHDASLIRKLMYYCLDFDIAWELAQKTNYFKAKDNFHKKKFVSERYKNITKKFLLK